MKNTQNRRETVPKKSPPARNPEQREKQLVNYAVDLAEEQLRNGTASSQVITHYLKMGTVREQLELERLRVAIKKDEATIKQIESEKERQELYEKAINVMLRYRMPE